MSAVHVWKRNMSVRVGPSVVSNIAERSAWQAEKPLLEAWIAEGLPEELFHEIFGKDAAPLQAKGWPACEAWSPVAEPPPSADAADKASSVPGGHLQPAPPVAELLARADGCLQARPPAVPQRVRGAKAGKKPKKAKKAKKRKPAASFRRSRKSKAPAAPAVADAPPAAPHGPAAAAGEDASRGPAGLSVHVRATV
jgi:hypothetical protein